MVSLEVLGGRKRGPRNFLQQDNALNLNEKIPFKMNGI
jgi:hypothetical protein